MDWLAVWESAAVLRRIEFATILVTVLVPLLSGTVLLTVRHRLKTLQQSSFQNQHEYYDAKIETLEDKNRALSDALERAQRDVSGLRRQTAPRQLTLYQEDLLLERLRGVRAAPVTVAAYAFEDESAVYAS